MPSHQTIIPNIAQQPAAMSSNKFDALGSDDSEVEESLNNHHQMEVEKTQPKLIWYTVWSPYVGDYFINIQIFLWLL